MSNRVNIANSQQVLERLCRQGSEGRSEISVVASPGARTIAWAVKIKSLSSYNVYNVRVVELGEPGFEPLEVGGEIEAVNLAESFVEEGQLSAGTYVMVSRVGEKNVFYAPV